MIIHWGFGIRIPIPRHLGIPTKVGISIIELVRIKFVQVANHKRAVSAFEFR